VKHIKCMGWARVRARGCVVHVQMDQCIRHSPLSRGFGRDLPSGLSLGRRNPEGMPSGSTAGSYLYLPLGVLLCQGIILGGCQIYQSFEKVSDYQWRYHIKNTHICCSLYFGRKMGQDVASIDYNVYRFAVLPYEGIIRRGYQVKSQGSIFAKSMLP